MNCPICENETAQPFGTKNGYALEKCSRCESLFVNPMPSATELSAFYQDYHKTAQYRSKLASKIRRAKKRIRRVRWRGKGKSFIDVGCNVGFAVEAARQLGFDAVGVDVDEIAISEARSLFPAARFEVADVITLAAEGAVFDVVYCSEVVEHLADPRPFVAALKQILAPGGRSFITTPNIAHASLPADLMTSDEIRPPEHLLYFTPSSLTDLLADAGFRSTHLQWTNKPTLKVIAS